ncbi:MAG TPA: hypothetical protein VF126_01250 [Acidobacteriaceae bacterium]
MRLVRSVCWLLIAGVVSPQVQASAQDLKVLVLDALNGKPQANVEVEYFCTRTQHNSAHKKALTSKDGSAKFPNPCSTEEEIEILVSPPDKKEQCGVGPITLKDILSVGAVAKPDSAGGIWCPTKMSRTLKPVPGQVILFVKKPTWWQSHVAG